MAERKERPGVMVYFETIDALEEFTDAEAGQFLRAACEYSRYGVLPDFQDRGLRALWKRAMHDLDRDAVAYRARCQQNRYNAYVSAEKRRFRIDHPMQGEAKEGKDFLTFDEWVEQIDESTKSERLQSQANACEAEPTGTSTPAPALAPIPATSATFPENHPYENIIDNGKGDSGEATPTALQAAWRKAMEAGDKSTASSIDNKLCRMGYRIDPISGNLTKRC